MMIVHVETLLTRLQFQELKTYFTEHEKQLKEQYAKVEALQKRADPNVNNRISLLGGTGGPTFEQLLAKRPGKDLADKLIGRYFNSYDPAVRTLKSPPPSMNVIKSDYFRYLTPSIMVPDGMCSPSCISYLRNGF